ncbi:MAG: hypothetical protein MI974_03790 [Chitinophagales bacterium]|nr:hypothetical protein [Chitinophagales bacterium]
MLYSTFEVAEDESGNANEEKSVFDIEVLWFNRHFVIQFLLDECSNYRG